MNPADDQPRCERPPRLFYRLLRFFFRRPLDIALLLIHVAWLIVAIFAVINREGIWIILGPLAWATSLAIIVGWHFVFCLAYRQGRKPGRVGWSLWLAPAVLMSLGLAGGTIHDHLPRTQFAAVVVDPIPPSVNVLKVGGEEHLLYGVSAFYFEIAPGDVQAILDNHDLAPTTLRHWELRTLAEDYLDVSLEELSPYDFYYVGYVAEAPSARFRDVYFAVSRDRNRAIFVIEGGS